MTRPLFLVSLFLKHRNRYRSWILPWRKTQPPSVSNFRRSTQRQQQLHTPSRPFAAFPLTPQTPGSQYSRETSHIRGPSLPNTVNLLSQTSRPEDVKKGGVTSVDVSQQYDSHLKAPLPDPPVSSGPTELINSNAASVIQQRLAPHETAAQHFPLLSLFLHKAICRNRPIIESCARFISVTCCHIELQKCTLKLQRETISYVIAQHVPGFSTMPKRDILDRQQDLVEELVSPILCSKSVIGQ